MGDIIRVNFNKGGFNEGAVEGIGREAALVKYNTHRLPRERSISKFGELPYLPDGKGWPVCSSCGKPLTFISQYNFTEAGLTLSKDYDLLTFYYCFDCKPWWDVAGRGFLAKAYYADPLVKLLPEKLAAVDDSGRGPKACEIDFKVFRDYPSAPEAARLLVLEEEVEKHYGEKYSPEVRGKIGGWPAWHQLTDTPVCRHCGGAMRLAAQIPSGEAHGLDWDGHGCMYIFVCEELCRRDAFSIVLQGE